MKKTLVLSTYFLCITILSSAQIAVSKGDLNMEIGGVLSTYYNKRWIKENATNQSLNKDRFKLRDARFFIKGSIGKKYEFNLQADLSSIGSGVADPESPTLFDANFAYTGIKTFKVIVGYGKLPYSRTSLVPFSKSPYWQRAEAFRGDIYSRRDVGLTLEKSFWQNRIKSYAGVYTGTGEVYYQGDNDPSGGLEYVGRIAISYPNEYKYREIDTDVSDEINIAVGGNARYTKRNLPEERTFIPGQTGEYGVKAINGERLGLGADAVVMFKGFSASFEIQKLKGTPLKDNDPLLRGIPKEQSKGFFYFGGWVAQANYFSKPLKTIFSVRYDQMDLNDLEPGRAERFSAALAFQLSGFKSMIKAQYFNVLKEDPMDPLRYKHQFRIGWQLALD
jgi:hypothetical protein